MVGGGAAVNLDGLAGRVEELVDLLRRGSRRVADVDLFRPTPLPDPLLDGTLVVTRRTWMLQYGYTGASKLN